MSDLSVITKVSVSSLAFAENGVVLGKGSSCLRMRQLKSAGVYLPDIPATLQRIGEFWERQVELELKLGHTDWEYVREQGYDWTINELGVRLRGRADFYVKPADGVPFLIECKALGSTARRLKVIRKREPDPGHIAQFVGYFLMSGINGGILRYAFIQESPDSDELMIPECKPGAANRADFSVVLRDGEILVDGEPYKYNLENLTQYIALVGLSSNNNSVAARPYVDPFNPFSSACRQCPFADTCDTYDERALVSTTPTLEQFIESCRRVAGSLTQSSFTIVKPKKRGKK
jgi:hypothetical protein